MRVPAVYKAARRLGIERPVLAIHRRLRSRQALAFLAGLATAVLFLGIAGLVRETSPGAIYVESPELYTRERLVNDRYRQDAWLDAQLAKLDETDNILHGAVSVERRIALEASAGAPGDEGGTTDGAEPAAAAFAIRLPFDLDHRVRSAIRESIRQSILENQLDDRHDLRGNSIYVLKFDTTVIPGSDGTQRAMVRVKVDPPPYRLLEMNGADGAADPDAPSPFVEAYYRTYSVRPEHRGSAAPGGRDFQDIREIEDLTELFGLWINNIQARMNAFARSYLTFFDTCQFDGDRYDDFYAFVVSQVDFEPGTGGAAIDAFRDRYRAQSTTRGKCQTIKAAISGDGDEISAGLRSFVEFAKDDETKGPLTAEDVFHRIYKRFVATEVISSVLSIPREDVSQAQFLSLSDVTIAPRHYRKLFSIGVNVRKDVYLDNFITVFPRSDSLYLLDACLGPDDVGRIEPGTPYFVDEVLVSQAFAEDGSVAPDRRPIVAASRGAGLEDSHRLYTVVQFNEPEPAVDVTPGLLSLAAGSTHFTRLPARAGARTEGAASPPCASFKVHLPSGLFNFAEALRRTDKYSYAVLPKGEDRAYLREATRAFSASLAAQAGSLPASLGAVAEDLTEIREAVAATTVVGFSGTGLDRPPGARPPEEDAPPAGSRPVEFGWIVAPPVGADGTTAVPVNRSMSALVAVPAWHRSLNITIETGWIDRGSGAPLVGSRKTELEVPLPLDLVAIDSVLSEEGKGRQPIIFGQDMDDYVLTACHPASIVIPGVRLWRSTRVTLGSQRADRIEVLPSMDGIIAYFDEIEPPRVVPYEGHVPLRVWTSEGRGELKNKVSVEDRRPESQRNQLCRLEAARYQEEIADAAVPQPLPVSTAPP